MYVYNDKAFSNAMKRTYTLRKTFMNSFQLLSWSHMRLRRVVINNCFKIEKNTNGHQQHSSILLYNVHLTQKFAITGSQ